MSPSMKVFNRIIAIFIVAVLQAGAAYGSKQAVDYVNPMIGTGGHGHTYPGATVPHGAVQLSPDTRTGDWDACGGYYYDDNTIQGFSHTHLSGTGCADLADVLFHPTVETGTPGNLYSPAPFSHSNETASPGYYSVKLNNGITAELTATTYCGVHRYSYPKNGTPQMVIDLTWVLGEETFYEAMLQQTAANEVVGMRNSCGWVDKQHVYFVAQFSSPITGFKGYEGNQAVDGNKVTGKAVQGVLTFAKRNVTVKVALSTVSIDNARQNLMHDTGNAFNFNAVRRQARDSWQKALSCFTITDPNENNKTIFYTALYHSLVVPNIVSDANGDYRTHNDKVKRLDANRKEYSTLSFWDTFRAWHPLITLIDAPLVSNIVNSALNCYDANGELPIWPLSSGETGCMIGYHSAAVIAEAYLKGINDFNTDLALKAMIATANTHRKGLDYYVRNGFIPQNVKRESVSCLLEYAYDDWAIAQYARAIGRNDVYEQYSRRAQQYANVFDGGTRFFRGKRSDGNWQTPFNPYEVGHAYTEATAWQYRFFVPHDVNGMEQLFGSRQQFKAALDSIYTAESDTSADLVDITGCIGQYAHGNEPSHHISYLYSYIGEPWKTQERNLQVLNTLYSATPDGLCGNEDCGQMSAWYVLTSIGLYSVCPASCQFILTTPLFEKASIRLTNGKTLTIVGGDSKATPYIARVQLNGEDITTTYLTYDQIMQGGTLTFTLSDKPTDWGTQPQAAPHSATQGLMASIPYVDTDLYLFEGEVTTAIGTATPGAEVRYTLDGSEPSQQSLLYTQPLRITATTQIKAKAYKPGYEPSRTMSITATKAEYAPPAQLSEQEQAALTQGIEYSYYEGPFLVVEDIKGTPIATGTMPEPSISNPRQPDHFAFVFEGYIMLPETGIYTFSTTSDDGSVLLIDGNLVVDNNESHAAVRATGLAALQKGLHRFTIKYFDDYEGESFAWGWKTPGSNTMSRIPASALFHIKK
ncbi:MAG: GH92 family glycosyl hydrolase [Muribaculaceae bacterium]